MAPVARSSSVKAPNPGPTSRIFSSFCGYYLYEQRKAKKLVIAPQEDGTLILTLPPSPEQEAIRWILGEGGNVEVLEPLDLRQKIHDLAVKTAEANSI